MVNGPWDDIAARRDEARALAAQRREEIAPGASTRTAASGPLYGVDSDRADATKRRLKALSLGPTLGLLLDTLARQIVADGVSSDRDDQGSARLWAPWEASGMPSRQTALWREALIDGAAYAAVDFDLRVNSQPCLLVGSRRRLRQDVLSRGGQGVETQHQRGT